MVYTYIIRSKKDKKWYTGTTTDLQKRLNEHNNNKVTSTKNRGPFELIYYEACIDMNDALARERYLKTGMGKRYLKNRMRRFLSLTGQVSLEIALSLICVFLLLGGSLAIFLWANNRFILRQEDYEKTRVEAGSNEPGKEIDESKYPKLDIFW